MIFRRAQSGKAVTVILRNDEAMRVGQMIAQLRDEYGMVLIDTSSKLDDRIMAVLENVDYILLLTSPELPAIKSAKLFLELLNQLQFDQGKIWVAINSANQPGGVPPD